MIPLSIPKLAGNEWAYVKECLDTGWISSAGSYVNKFEEEVAKSVGAKYGIACVNGTAGLHIAQIACGVQSSDYVIVPNLTFVATLNSIRYTGAEPILIDADPNTWQLDLDLLEQFLVEKTELKKIDDSWNTLLKSNGRRISTIMPVHVLGNMLDMARLIQIAQEHHLNIIEDSTEALGSYFKNQHAGSFGEVGVFSFNGNKIISTGGGGVIVTDNVALAKRIKHLSTTAKISPSDYVHDEVGYNYRLVNVLAAIGLAQMEQLPEILKKKKKIDKFYRDSLNNISDVKFQEVDNKISPNCWLFTMSVNKMRSLLRHLNDQKIQARAFWMPMNQLNMYKENLYISKSDNCSKLYESCISIPSSTSLSRSDQISVCDAIRSFYENLN